MMLRPGAACGFAATMAFFAPRSVGATPHLLPFSYQYETLSEGTFEFEFATDMNPLRVYANPASARGGLFWEPYYQLTTEFEYGLTNRIELAFYQVIEALPQNGGSNAMQFDGLKWRVRARLAEAGDWPVDVSLYLELETMHDEVSLEEKVNLERRFGSLVWLANLWVEQSLGRPFDTGVGGQSMHYILNPTTGFSYQVSPWFHPGVEYWARGELQPVGGTQQERSNNGIHHFLGPAINLNFGKFWWSIAMYAHLSADRSPLPGDAYGPLWVRSVVGVEL